MPIACQWQRDASRPYLYAGECGASYAQLLIDQAKAFDIVPHWLLVREAQRLGYPLRMLRLSLAAYRMDRVVRICSVISVYMVATRGITAGSGLACDEM